MLDAQQDMLQLAKDLRDTDNGYKISEETGVEPTKIIEKIEQLHEGITFGIPSDKQIKSVTKDGSDETSVEKELKTSHSTKQDISNRIKETYDIETETETETETQKEKEKEKLKETGKDEKKEKSEEKSESEQVFETLQAYDKSSGGDETEVSAEQLDSEIKKSEKTQKKLRDRLQKMIDKLEIETQKVEGKIGDSLKVFYEDDHVLFLFYFFYFFLMCVCV